MKNDPYFELLEIIKAQDQLEKLGQRLALAGLRLAKKIHESDTITLSPSDRPYETFKASEEPINE